jgi:hypothetical protein
MNWNQLSELHVVMNANGAVGPTGRLCFRKLRDGAILDQLGGRVRQFYDDFAFFCFAHLVHPILISMLFQHGYLIGV